MNKFLSDLPINLFRIFLIAEICFLAYNDLEGWGWLTFILFITL